MSRMVAWFVALCLACAALAAGDDDLAPSRRVRQKRARAKAAKRVAPPVEIEEPEQSPDPDAAPAREGGGAPTVYRGRDTEVRIAGDRTVQVSQDVIEFHGHVEMERRGHKLTTDKIRYDRKSGELVATGNVVLSDPRFSLTCGRFVLYGAQEMGIAWESPKILEIVKGPDGEIRDRMEITAFQMTFFTTENRVEGLERVRIYRQIRRGDRLELDFKVTADSMDANLVTKQSVFKGEVKVESPTYTVEAQRLIFDQVADRFTCIGDARVVGYGAKGEEVSRVEGTKIIHLIRERRSLVMGGVTAMMLPGKPIAPRKIDAASLKDSDSGYEVLTVPDSAKVDTGKAPKKGRKR